MKGGEKINHLALLIIAAFVLQGCSLAPGMKTQTTTEGQVEEGNYVNIATITTVELTAAVSRKVRGGHLAQADADHIFRWFESHCVNEYSVVPLEDNDLDRACALAAGYGLRAYDAVQLSVCLALQQLRIEHEGPPITLVSSDKELNDAGTQEGLIVVNPDDLAS